MKYVFRVQAKLLAQSPPTRGAWIEMTNPAKVRFEPDVAPHTGGVD